MKKKKKKKQRSKNFFMFFNLFFILQLVLPKSNLASKNSNPSQEHQRKEKINYHLSPKQHDPQDKPQQNPTRPK